MEDYKELFDEIISLAWRNFIRKFRRGEIMASEKSLSEVMFQFCFANEIQSTGREYIGLDKVLEVNLETKWSNPKTDTVQPKLIDITCHIIDDGEEKYACAIELKFKRKRDAKGTFGKDRMFKFYKDIEYLEQEISVTEKDRPKPSYSEGRFYCITDNAGYFEKTCQDDSDNNMVEFGLKNNASTTSEKIHVKSKGDVKLEQSYFVQWESHNIPRNNDIQKWYFLEIKVTR